MASGTDIRVLAAAAVVLLAAGVQAQVTIGGKPYVRRETREATRDAMLAELTGVAVVWGPWHVLSPLDHPPGAKDIATPYPPEDGLGGLRAGGPGPDLLNPVKAKGGNMIVWRVVEAKQDIGGVGGLRPLNLAEGLAEENRTSAVGYLYRTIRADRAGELPVAVGSDDGLRLWFNGELLIDENAERALDPRAHRVALRLQPGVNHLLAKVSQGAGEWKFQMAQDLEPDPVAAAALDYQLDSDFPDAETRYYRIVTVPHPRGVSLEVGGMDLLPGGGGLPRPVVCTRRGEVWVVDGAYDVPPVGAGFTLFASGLQEPLGLRVMPSRGGEAGIVVAQRGELTELRDSAGRGRADVFRTICDDWTITGNYHEYAFGPKLDRAGNYWVTLNLAHTGGETTMGATVATRGWAVRIDPATGVMTKIADGLRSPDGIGLNADGEMFYTDNQGDYVATNKLCHLKEGGFYGHQASLKFREGYGPAWRADGRPVPEITQPAVWFPYKKMGQSASDILLDDSGGAFGPFAGQLFVGDQTYASIFRVFLEKVKGADGQEEYQGACFPFRQGFASGVHRMVFAPPDASGRASMFVGMTDRGWGSTGPKRDGLQRLVWTGEVPFEILAMRARPDGFELEFTRDIAEDAADPAHYRMSSYTYTYHPAYGSPEVDAKDVAITEVEWLPPRSVRLRVSELRTGPMGFVYELHAPGVRSAPDAQEQREPLLHPEAYYTLQRAPVAGGEQTGK